MKYVQQSDKTICSKTLQNKSGDKYNTNLINQVLCHACFNTNKIKTQQQVAKQSKNNTG